MADAQSIETRIDGLHFIQPNWRHLPTVNVYSTTRVGGVSQAPFNALNLGLHVNDNQGHVRSNRGKVARALQFSGEPLWLNQVHGTNVFDADNSESIKQLIAQNTEADGSYTTNANQVLCVVTADCLPVVISNADGTAVSVVHAGWKGLAAGVLDAALAKFPTQDSLFAWLGPAIGPLTFEVGAEVREAFVNVHNANEAAFKSASSGSGSSGKFLADIYQLARNCLSRNNEIQISGGEYCTYTQSDLFHSYRRDGVKTGRMATYVWIS